MKEYSVEVILKVEGRDRWQADALTAQAVERMAGSPGVEAVSYKLMGIQDDKACCS